MNNKEAIKFSKKAEKFFTDIALTVEPETTRDMKELLEIANEMGSSVPEKYNLENADLAFVLNAFAAKICNANTRALTEGGETNAH